MKLLMIKPNIYNKVPCTKSYLYTKFATIIEMHTYMVGVYTQTFVRPWAPYNINKVEKK